MQKEITVDGHSVKGRVVISIIHTSKEVHNRSTHDEETIPVTQHVITGLIDKKVISEAITESVDPVALKAIIEDVEDAVRRMIPSITARQLKGDAVGAMFAELGYRTDISL